MCSITYQKSCGESHGGGGTPFIVIFSDFQFCFICVLFKQLKFGIKWLVIPWGTTWYLFGIHAYLNLFKSYNHIINHYLVPPMHIIEFLFKAISLCTLTRAGIHNKGSWWNLRSLCTIILLTHVAQSALSVLLVVSLGFFWYEQY